MKKLLCTVLLFVSAILIPQFSAKCRAADEQPAPQCKNVLIIITDQQSADMMSCVQGDRWLKTPNMDALAASGMLFRRAYTSNPLCVPLRSALVTGHYPHQTGVQTNSSGRANMQDLRCVGEIFKSAGFKTAYFGKWHVSIPMDEKNEEWHGFDVRSPGGKAQYESGAVVDFIKSEHEKPFLAIASFMNPHNICEWSRFQKLPGGEIGDVPALDQLPPLP